MQQNLAKDGYNYNYTNLSFGV